MNDDKLCISPDALIAMIVTEAQDRALAQMSGPEAAGDVQPSDAFLRKMDALVRNPRRKADRKRHLRAAKRLLITLAAAMAIFSCTMLPVKAVRDAVVQTLMTWHDQFVAVSYVSEEWGVMPESVTLSYLPDGFTLTEVREPKDVGHYYASYDNTETGAFFTVMIVPIQGRQDVFLDDEHSQYYSITFDGHDAIWGDMFEGQMNDLLWEHNKLACSVEGNISLHELIKIAQGIVLE